MTVNQRVSGSSPEGGASESTTYGVLAVGGFLFAQQFAQRGIVISFILSICPPIGDMIVEKYCLYE